MKTKFISLVFMLVFAFSTSAFADGETGQVGGETGQVGVTQPPPPVTQPTGDLITQIIVAITSVVS